jgi:FixJ family two-component response regulator
MKPNEKRNMIYIVDDDHSVRRALLLLMQSADFNAQAFSSAGKLLESAELTDHDCIILDLSMPGVKGFDLLLDLSTRGTRTPVIVVSTFDDEQGRSRAHELGAVSFLRKPVDGQALIDTINWALEGKKAGVK